MKTVFLILVLCLSGFAQSPDLDRGVELYRQGNFASALVVLEKLSAGAEKDNGLVWNYIGLCYLKIDDLKIAEAALSKAVKLMPENSTIRSNYGFVLLLRGNSGRARSELTKAIGLDPKNVSALFLRGTARFWKSELDEALSDADAAISHDQNLGAAYTLKADILIAMFGNRVSRERVDEEANRLLREAAATVEKCIRTCTGTNVLDEQKSRQSAIDILIRHFKLGDIVQSEDPVNNDPAVTPLKIISKPRPGYTDDARLSSVQGTIKLLVIFDAGGTVSGAFIVKSLGHGLDRQAYLAARRIVFEPAKRNGVPFSVVKFVEYSFSIF